MNRFNAKEFLNELDELLHETPFVMVDILQLIDKYCKNSPGSDPSSVRITIQGLLHQYEKSGWIQGEFHAQLAWQRPTAIECIEEPICIRSTVEFEQHYEKKHLPPSVQTVQNIQNIETNTGLVIQGTEFYETDFRPTINQPIEQITKTAKEGQKTSGGRIGKFIMKHIVAIIVMVISGLIVAYFVFVFKWNK